MASTPVTYRAELETPAPRGLVASIARAIAQELRIRRDMRQLRAMDDHMLKDIGLTRAEIGSAVRYGRD
jgi:uncharacterized protein YjiS (DUF1127 family)